MKEWGRQFFVDMEPVKANAEAMTRSGQALHLELQHLKAELQAAHLAAQRSAAQAPAQMPPCLAASPPPAAPPADTAAPPGGPSQPQQRAPHDGPPRDPSAQHATAPAWQSYDPQLLHQQPPWTATSPSGPSQLPLGATFAGAGAAARPRRSEWGAPAAGPTSYRFRAIARWPAWVSARWLPGLVGAVAAAATAAAAVVATGPAAASVCPFGRSLAPGVPAPAGFGPW